MTFRLICADSRTLPLPDKSVQCVVTSPPYWALRDYGADPIAWAEVTYTPMPGLPPVTIPAMVCALGLEPTPEAFIGHMMLVMRELWRVLRDDGTAWINFGDSYSNDTKWGGTSGGKNYTSAAGGYQGQRVRRGKDCDPNRGAAADGQPFKRTGGSGLKPKDLVGIPWRFAFAAQAEGWYLRQDLIWHKPAPMPESVRDRCTKAHEYIFLLTKSERYYFDADAIAEEGQGAPVEKMPGGWAVGSGDHSAIAHQTEKNHRKVNGGACFGKQREDATGTGAQQREYERPVYDKRNKRSVWTVASQGFKGAHFATFPEKLITPCILAGSKPGDTVLDPFNGAGTTGLVCQKLGRDYIGIDVSEKYLAMSRKRIIEASPLFATEVA